MEIRKTIIPCSSSGKQISGYSEREYIFFTVNFNNYRDVSGSVANEVTDKEIFDQCECVLCLPESYSDTGDETPLILSFHGAGSRVCEAENLIGGVHYVSQCIDAGYAALDVCGSAPHGLTLGCPEHLFAIYKAYKYVTKHYNVSKNVLVSGASMGGHTAMNFANMFPSLVTAIGIFYPRLNINGVTVNGHYCIGTWDKTTPKASTGKSTRDRIIDIYRFPTNDWCEEHTEGFNPYRSRSYVNENGERCVIPPCPVKIWQGTADTTVDPVMVEEFYKSIRRAGCYAELHLLDGVGHKIQPAMREELLMWFNRFV